MRRPKALSRRVFLRESAKLAAAIAVAPAGWRLRDCKAGPVTRAVSERAPAGGGVCVSRVPSPSGSGPDAVVRPPLHPDALASFVDPLPIPQVLSAKERRLDPRDPRRQIPVYRVVMHEADVRIHRDLPATRMWTYEGTMPGPTIEVRSGEGALVEWVNELPTRHFLPIDPTLHGAGPELPEVRAVVHVHGAKAPPESDGYPEHWLVPGQSLAAHYPSRQEAATLWYHDHAMGIERLNQYAGLLGCFFVRDAAEDALDLPKGPFEIPLVVCDRMFYADGQLMYPTSGDARSPWLAEAYGDVTLVNGKLRPYVDVEPRAYRLRIINASNARVFRLGFSGRRTFHQIGSDQGLLSSPVALSEATLAPGERVDLVADFESAAGGRLVLQNQGVPLLELRVASGPRGERRALPATLRPVPRLRASEAVRERKLTLQEYRDPRNGRMLMLLDGRYWHEPVTERPKLDTIEIWSLMNLTQDTHPIHLHLVRFQILDRQLFDLDEYGASGKLVPLGPTIGPSPEEAGWKDTVRAGSGTITRIIARFDGFPGKYVWHCHVLEHAANEMMRPFEVVGG